MQATSDSVSEKIAQQLTRKIITGELPPKARIQEKKIAGELEVSRSSVREAFLILKKRYLIEIIPHRGAVVTELTPHHVTSIYEMMTPLYTLLAIKVANIWQNETQVSPFVPLLENLQQHANNGDVANFGQCSFQIMRMAYPLANNPYLEETLENLQPAIERTYNLALSKHANEIMRSLGFFESIFNCMIKKDANMIRHTINRYGEHYRELVLSII
jgi:DNA-binding GntR family transcriptional regulator